MSALLAFALLLGGAASGEVVVLEGETLAEVATRALGDADSAAELRALNSLQGDQLTAGTTLKLPGPDRALAVSALAAARHAVDQADSTAANRQEASLRLKEAETLFKSARYQEAAKAADAAWQLVSASAREPTRFAVKVEENGSTEVKSRSGQPVRVESAGVAAPVYAGQSVKVEKGQPPSPPELPLTAPTPLAPDDGKKVSAAQATQLVLSWSAVRGASAYQLRLGGPKPLLLEVKRTRAKLPPLPPGTYQWSVRALSQKSRSEPSRDRSLEVLEEPLKLEVGKTEWK